jgi:hypothetical protein
MKDLPQITKTDTFPLWSFGYMHPSDLDDSTKVMTARGRTWQEAWFCIQHINHSFVEPSKVGRIAVVSLSHKEDYSKTHPYDWFHDAPLWLKQATDQTNLIW